MKSYSATFRQAMASVLLSSLLAGTVGISWAEQVLKCPRQGVEAQLKNDVQGATATPGQPFEAELQEDLRYKNWVLPAGTDFRGEITRVGHSKRFNRPGYVVLHVKEAALPNGSTFTFDEDKYKPRDKELHDPSALTFQQSLLTQLPYTLVALAVTVPLRYGADANGLALVPVGAGIRMVAGALFRPKYKDEPVPRKLALGALDGSGIPRVVGFVSKYPEPNFHTGDTIKLYFNPNGLKDLFQSTSSASLKTEGRITSMAPASQN
jgi:hypothetical protein